MRARFPLPKHLISTLTFLCVALFLLSDSLHAQYFGRNKVNYKQFNFRVVQSPHFELYHYLENVAVRNRMLQQAEQWYRMHQTLFQDTFAYKNPLLLYSNHADFQQTKAIEGQIGVGTGGVTEALKNRVIMPMMESNAQTDHVLGHELVHAFQYHIIQDTFSLSTIGNLPLWMVEGLAEYMSIGPVDAHTAIWLRAGVAAGKLPTLKDLTNRPDEYFPYRWGQAFWAYATGLKGDAVIQKLFIETARSGYEHAIKDIFEIDAKTFSENWKTALRTAYGTYQKSTSAVPPGRMLVHQENAGELNIVPSLSPDGKRIAYWSEKELFSVDLFVANAESGENLKRITTNGFGSHIDEYSSFESSVAWSPDSRRLAFIAFAKGRNRLIIANAGKGNILNEIDVPGVPALSNPTWSPDGTTIVLTGLVDGQSDLYAYNISNHSVKRLTNDRYSDLQPYYSPDGKWIAFATDKRSIGSNHIQHEFSHDIALLNVATGVVTILDIFKEANNLNPVFAADNNVLYFLSDRDGFRNLYSYNLATRQLEQLTNLFTGITGITMFSPAISAARQADLIAYTYYSNDLYTLYTTTTGSLTGTPVLASHVNRQTAMLPPFTRAGGDVVQQQLASPSLEMVPAADLTEVPFKPKFQLDYIGNTGIGVGVGLFGTGVVGGINGIFSDILGNNQLFGAVALNGEIYDFGGQFAYLHQKKRINWGVALSHIPYLSGGESIFLDSLKAQGDTTIAAVNYSLDLLRTFEDEVSFFAALPFSQVRRIEAGTSFSRYSYRLDRYSDYYDPATGVYLTSERKKLPTPSGFNLVQGYLAYVGDNSNFGVASPLTGHRYRLEVGQYIGAIRMSSLLGDYRKYFRLAPITLATRHVYVGRFGRDAENGVLPPLYVGYSTLVRGYDANIFTEELASRKGITINDLNGSQMYVGNLELRYPLTGPERLSRFKSRFLLTELNLFTDGGIAWGNYQGFTTGDKGQRLLRESKAVLSTGLSLRINLFGYLILEPFYAVPWQNGGFRNANFGLNFTPGW